MDSENGDDDDDDDDDGTCIGSCSTTSSSSLSGSSSKVIDVAAASPAVVETSVAVGAVKLRDEMGTSVLLRKFRRSVAMATFRCDGSTGIRLSFK